MIYKKNKWIVVICLLVLSGLLGFGISFYQYRQVASVATPTESDVTVIQTFHYPALFVKQLKGDPDAGRKIFKEFCAACHAEQPTIDVPAPRIGDKAAWQARSRMGMPTLLKITINGAGAMPARGGCFECSDKQLQETITYIMNHSK